MKDDMKDESNGLSRRSFLLASGLLGLTVDPTLNHLSELFAEDDIETTEIEYFRPGDLLHLRFILKNIKPDNNGQLIKVNSGQSAYVFVELPPQHIGEEYVDNGHFLKNIVVKAFAAKNSYLVFTLTKSRMPIEKLLDWTKDNTYMFLDPLDGSADQYDLVKETSSTLSSTRELIHNTTSKVPYTTLELPAGIFLSPLKTLDKTRIFFTSNKIKGEFHDPAKKINTSFDKDTRLTYNAELWQNEMLSDDPAVPTPNLRLVTTIIDPNRDQIVQPTDSDKNNLKEHFRNLFKDSNPFIKTSLLRLSSLGMSTVMDYYASPESKNIVKWHHDQTNGHDNTDEIHNLGYIYPLGLRIAYIQKVDRVIEDGVCYQKHWSYMAPLDMSLVIHSDEELKPDSYVFNQPSYNGITLEDQLGKIKRNLQYKEIRVVTPKTPPIRPVAQNEIIGGKINGSPAAFWPVLEGSNQKLELDFVGIDWSGQAIPFKTSFIFVSGEVMKRMEGKEEEKNLRKEKLLRDKLQETNQAINRPISTSTDLSTLRQAVVNAHTEYLNFIESADYKGNDEIQKIVKFDSDLSNAYRIASSLTDRQIQLGNQSVVYHLDHDAQGVAIIPDIAKLETQFIEFTATSLCDFFTLRQQAVEKQLQAFQNLNQAFLPQLAIASVKLPVIKELAKYDSNVLLKYADSFVQAGAKFTVQNHPNLERILFSIQNEKAAIRPIFVDISATTINRARQQLQQLQSASLDKIIQNAKDLQAHIQENALAWLKQTQAYTEGSISNLFEGAKASLGGTIDPSVAIHYVSLIQDAHYTLQNKVDEYSGQVINYVKKQGTSFIYDAEKQGDQILNKILGDIKIFGLPLVTYIKSNIPIDNLPKPGIKRTNGQTTVSYNWKLTQDDLKLDLDPDGIFRPRGKHDKNQKGFGDGNFLLNLTLQTVLYDSGDSHTTSSIALNNFGINMLDLVALYFGQVTLKTEVDAPVGGTVQTSTKTDLMISDVAFGSFLSLVQKLQAVLGQSNFILDISPRGILLSQGLRLPPISTGPFTMSNIALYTGLRLNFTGAPSLRFAFGEKINPFTLAVGVFGGRGYIGIDVATEAGKPSIRQLDGALEFGGYVGIDLGVAKGEAYLMAGIFFLKRDDGLSVVEAYITCGGALSILGLITVSVCFRLGMSYQNGALYGRASLQVRVKLLFFSASYTLTFEKRIAGSESNFTAFLPSYDTANQLWAYAGGENGAAPWLNSAQIPDIKQIPPYCMIDQRKSSKDSLDELVPVYDPTLIHGHDIDKNDLNQYCSFYAL